MKRLTFLLICTLFLLTACGKVSNDNIYTVAKVDGDMRYAYNSSGQFVSYDSSGQILPHSGAGITARPCLTLISSGVDYAFSATDTPCLYRATWESVNNYIAQLESEDLAEIRDIYLTWSEADLTLVTEEYRLRIIWNLNGDTHIYAVDNYNSPIVPPYIIKSD